MARLTRPDVAPVQEACASVTTVNGKKSSGKLFQNIGLLKVHLDRHTLNAHPWTEETAYDNVNALFEFEQPTNNGSGRINFVAGSYVCGSPQPPIELQHRRREISTLAFNGNPRTDNGGSGGWIRRRRGESSAPVTLSFLFREESPHVSVKKRDAPLILTALI
ncbi:hypothetical protein C8R44DRAFT_742930 [Mycena epipterygia]|nr:hypothetical protein C8R44DRAFT_742930 [Mycena epipterygia]